MSQSVTFQTVLAKQYETAKAVKVFGGAYLPKSLVTVQLLWEEDRADGKRQVACQVVNVTMPAWLARR